ncbi:FGGY-family carbohydrate kinase [Shouchella sp. 1P09AA]|uniref:FGGY-family carbohydrate kinase n=1 Tax=unclassified Shouchella TaxID=2893065 RepID=UPI0039A13521
MRYVLGIDNGGTLTKAALYDLSGKEIQIAMKKTRMITTQPYHTERDCEELWQANLMVIREVLASANINAEDIIGISITGHGNGLYMANERGEPTYNGIISTDQRATTYVEQWKQDGRFEGEILPKTMQSVWAGQPVSLLAWLKDNEPDVLNKTTYIFMVKDYVRFKLTGEAYVEETDASGTCLLNVRDRCYDRELLSFFGIEDVYEKLPPLKRSTECCGHITETVAQLTGLKEGTPVAGGIFDISASAIASGIVREDQLCIVAGTWSINEYITTKPVIDKHLFMTSIYCMEGYWLTTEASPTSASNLEWYIDEWMKQEKVEAERQGRSIYDECNELVAKTKAEDSQLLFLPFLFGSNTVRNASSCFIGLSSWHTRAYVLRAIYEGVVFSHLAHVKQLLHYRKAPTSVRIAGGVTKSDVWVQMFADALQLPLEIVDIQEHGTLGTAMCAAVMAGTYKSIEEASTSMVNVARRIEPNLGKAKVYQQKFKLYQQTVEKMEQVWALGAKQWT